ncbi:cuticle protein 19 [Hyalella azteca]|uniref:Cuticle protein 19 n=1 Tax=Hyalella azteca TaxID=294128 RepID=A0A8B7P7U2_HYAAZ|nr:cuticle protein 19 [Hyalella azteca]
MAAFKIALVLALAVACALADERPRYTAPAPRPSYEAPRPSYSAPRPAERSEEEYDEAKYELEWKVDEDGNNFGQSESRDGDETKGSYVVDLPDGRRQTVTYSVDGDSGFVAEVSYEGEAQYPEEESEEQRYEAPRPTYQAPRSAYDN